MRLRLSIYTSAVELYFAQTNGEAGSNQDFWLAVAPLSRNTRGSAPRGSWPVTRFARKGKEILAEMHYTGFACELVMGEIFGGRSAAIRFSIPT